jgi:hypothetical protein
MMKRRDFIKVTGMGVAGAATVAAPAIAQSMPEIKWRMTTSWPKSLDTLHGGAEQMAKAVGEATDNKFQIQTFAAGEIVPGLQVLDAVQNGTVELGHTASYYYFGKDPTFTFGSSVPFGPNMRLNQAWYMLGGGKEVLNEFFKSYNVSGMVGGWSDAARHSQSRQVECAAEILSECSRAGRSLRQQLDDGKIRRGKSHGLEEAARRRHQAARVLAADHGSELQGSEGTARRGRRDQCEFQEGL